MAYNYTAAKAAGLTDQEIGQYLASKGQTQTPNQTNQSGGFANYLPLLGAITGSFSPFGPILGGAGGAALGTGVKQLLQGQPNPAEVVGQAGLAGIGGLGGKLAGGILSNILPRFLTKAGTGAIGSQLGNIGKGVARAERAGETIPELAKYGITDVGQYIPTAEQVTGKNGIINAIKQRAISQANPVELGSYQTAVNTQPSVLSLATDLAQDPALGNQQQKFLNFIKGGLQKSYGGAQGNITGMAEPSRTFKFIQELQAKANDLVGRGRPLTAITSQDKALASSYKQIADELEHRLYNISGANAQVIDQITPEEFASLQTIHPKLAKNVAGTQTVAELRALEAPFVRGSNLAKESILTGQTGFQNIGQTAQGLGKLVPSIANPLAPIEVGLSQPEVNAAVGGVALKGAQALRNLPLPFGKTLARIGVAGATGLGTQTPQAQAKESETTNNLFPQETKTPKPQDVLRQRLGILALSRAKNVSDLVASYNLLYPKPTALPQEFLRAQTGIDVINNLKQIPQQTLNKTGTARAAAVHAKLNFPKGLGRYFISKGENDLASLESQYFLLTQGVLTAIQGSRPSDYDAKVYQNFAGPSIQFPNYVNQQRVQNFLNLLQAKINQTTPATIPLPQGGQ